MSTRRKHDYIDMDLKPRHMALLKAGRTVHIQLKGYRNRVAIKVKNPLDKKISYHKQMLDKLMKERRGYSMKKMPKRRKWTAESRAKLSESMKRAHKRKPNWKS